MLESLISNSDIQAEIRSALRAINGTLFSDNGRSGLLAGLAGEIACAWYCHKVDPGLVDTDRMEKAIARLQELAPEARQRADVSSGIPGFAWLFELLLADQDDPYEPLFNANVDEVLTQQVDEERWNGELEYVLGLSGIGMFAARRWRMSGESGLYRAVVEAFARHAEWQPDGCAWPTPETSVFRFNKRSADERPESEYNLGLAHGVPGIIAALLPAVDDSVLGEQAARMVSRGCDWLWAQRQNPNHHGSWFGNLAATPGKSRLGWCYGDVSIALTLLRAGKGLGRDDYIDAAHQVAEHAAHRGVQDGAVKDAGLCHGSAGLFLLFLLLDRHAPRPAYRAAAEVWLTDVLERYEQEGLAGFDCYRVDPDSGKPYREAETGFLSGYAGIGLCLTAAAGVEPTWVDGILLG